MSKKRSRSSLKGTEKYIEPSSFDKLIDALILENQQKYSGLLKPQVWTVDADVRKELLDVSEALTLRLMHRSSLFAMHRTKTTPEKMKKAKVVLTADDVDMAWKTINMDSLI